MSTTAPSTPKSTPRKAALTRSFTLPSKVATTSRTAPSAEIGAAEGIETLHVHPNGKVVKFTTSATSRPGSSTGIPSPGGQHAGTLPWATLTEQTLAAGPIEIYRVPGSVSFLHSGSLLHAIMPRSNCWCVDGVSKFAIRVLADTYYRVELPGETPEDLEKVEEFKDTLKKVLFYERTACPFARTFTVELPEEPEVRKKRRKSHGPAKKWTLEKAYRWKPEDGEAPQRGSERFSGSLTASDEESSSEDAQSNASEVADEVKDLKINTPSRPSVRERAMGFDMRSVTAPPHLAMQATPPSKLRTTAVAQESHGSRERSRSPEQAPGALDPTSLRPFQPIPTDMPPSPPDSSAGPEYTEHPSRTALPEQANVPDAPNPSRTAYVEPGISSGDVMCAGEGAAADSAHAGAAQSDEKPEAALQSEVDRHTNVIEPKSEPVFVAGAEDAQHQGEDRGNHAGEIVEAASDLRQETNQFASLSRINTGGAKAADADEQPRPSALQCKEQNNGDFTARSAVGAELADPFAQIQARIQARRSIGGTTSFVPSRKSPTRQSSSSTASSGSLSSARSGLSLRSHPYQAQQQQAFASALVRKACSVFLGPPAHLVLIMLRIAARFAKGAFPRSLLFESPAGASKRVPGSFDLDGSDVEDFAYDDDIGDWEDDFGVPLRSPVRLAAAMNEVLSRTTSNESSIANVRG
ncbi:hypothetical protein DOTSEDRAFT_72910 [Lecanosticta acicola]|uniref:Inheritance of peroxisomes protein 1 n=1 Tax=Lecanosticta acicola TaxID=111012 RepID=A0AAI9EDK4_9PEZI|nr:hypothetical protein DOTSEDRAFT_72910 [Lecanosticta acicola]